MFYGPNFAGSGEAKGAFSTGFWGEWAGVRRAMQLSMAQFNLARIVSVKPGPVRVRYGPVLYGTVRYGTVRYGTVRYGTVRYGTVRYGTVRCGTVR